MLNDVRIMHNHNPVKLNSAPRDLETFLRKKTSTSFLRLSQQSDNVHSRSLHSVLKPSLMFPPFFFGSSKTELRSSIGVMLLRSSLLRWYTIPAPRESPITLIAVRNLEFQMLYHRQWDCDLVSPVQKPVNSEDEGHSLTGKPHSLQHHHHGHESRLGNARSPNACRCGRYGDGEDVTDADCLTVNLGYEEGGNCLVQSCPILK